MAWQSAWILYSGLMLHTVLAVAGSVFSVRLCGNARLTNSTRHHGLALFAAACGYVLTWFLVHTPPAGRALADHAVPLECLFARCDVLLDALVTVYLSGAILVAYTTQYIRMEKAVYAVEDGANIEPPRCLWPAFAGGLLMFAIGTACVVCAQQILSFSITIYFGVVGLAFLCMWKRYFRSDIAYCIQNEFSVTSPLCAVLIVVVGCGVLFPAYAVATRAVWMLFAMVPCVFGVLWPALAVMADRRQRRIRRTTCVREHDFAALYDSIGSEADFIR